MTSDTGGNTPSGLEQVGVRWRYLDPTDERFHSSWERAARAPERASEDEDEIESEPVFIVVDIEQEYGGGEDAE